MVLRMGNRDRKMGKAVTCLESKPVTAHEVSNISTNERNEISDYLIDGGRRVF